MAKITFKYCTKKKAQYLEKVIKLRRQGRSIPSILQEVPIGRTTVYLWINEVFKGGAQPKSPETSSQGEMKKKKPTAVKSDKVATELIAAPEIVSPATIADCQAALKNNAESINNPEETEEDVSLAGLDEKALKKMVKKLRKEVKTQTVRGDLYKKMLQIASEDTGIDFLKKPGAGQ